MTSSKSNRASSGQSSTSASLSSSLYSQTTPADRDSSADSPGASDEKQSVPAIRLASTPLDTSQKPDGAEGASAKHEATSTAGQMASAGPVLMSPQPEVLRKRSKLNRLSSFFPSLISPSSDSNAHRKPVPTDSPVKEKRSTVSDWEAQLRSRFESPSTDKLTLGGSLGLDGKPGHKKQSSQEATKMGKLRKPSQVPPPLPTSPAPPIPSKAAERPITPSDPGFYFTETKPSPKLTKPAPAPAPAPRRRSSSLHNAQTSPKQSGLAPRGVPASPIEPRGRSSSAQPPSNRLEPGLGNRQVSAAAALDSRPTSSSGSQSPTRDGDKRGRLRRSWFPGARSRSNSQDMRAQSAGAWTLGPTKADYNTSFLEKGEHVPELWNESGSVLVYLHPKASGRGPSFKVMSFVTDYALFFQDLIEADATSSRTTSFTGRDSLSVADAERGPDSPPSPPVSEAPGESRLYLATVLTGQLEPGNGPQPDLDRLIAMRNMFALLTGQPLVGNKSQPTIFAALMRVSGLLTEFDFTSVDGTTFGDSVDMSFGFFMEGLAVADVRHSREKTLEALVLGERMKSWELYNEAFSHAVGKYTALLDLHSPLWDQVSEHTRQRLERGHFELLSRQNNVNTRLENFEFPALFSGLANSTTQYKNVKFGRWKSSFGRMRSFVLGYYKSSFGSWPPKARSKKNPFTESGLNRQVLKILYSDLCALYDLIVDRQSLTPRSMDSDKMEEDENDPMSALRRILTEFDQSSPPVLPPIPYDTPRLPDFRSVKENYYDLPAKDQKKLDSNYQEHEFLLILSKSYDFETLRLKLPFTEAFKDFEEKEAKGKPISEIADQRIGYFLFLYVVIQSLPMLVVDAPGLNFTEGVEYFLCQPPKGQPPWLGEAAEVRKRWYEVSGGAGYVELSEDTIEFSIEGIYHRSHCWVAAKQWEQGMAGLVADTQDFLPPLEAPQSVFADNDPGISLSPKPIDRSESPTAPSPGMALRPRGASPAGRPGYRSSVALGLEPVAMAGEERRGSLRTSRVLSGREGSIGPRPTSAMMGRSRSSSNIHSFATPSPGFASPDSRSSSRHDSQMGGSTFDDILKDMDSKPKKKKNFFG
ncbi:putative Choriogenin Hminor [Seiridium cardinale]